MWRFLTCFQIGLWSGVAAMVMCMEALRYDGDVESKRVLGVPQMVLLG